MLPVDAAHPPHRRARLASLLPCGGERTRHRSPCHTFDCGGYVCRCLVFSLFSYQVTLVHTHTHTVRSEGKANHVEKHRCLLRFFYMFYRCLSNSVRHACLRHVCRVLPRSVCLLALHTCLSLMKFNICTMQIMNKKRNSLNISQTLIISIKINCI